MAAGGGRQQSRAIEIRVTPPRCCCFEKDITRRSAQTLLNVGEIEKLSEVSINPKALEKKKKTTSLYGDCEKCSLHLFETT